jgi:hypothetical protein
VTVVEAAAARINVRRLARRRDSVDLVLLGVLVFAMAMFGRPFAKIQLVPHIYPTEVLIALTALATLARTGLRGAAVRIAASLPLWLVGLYWVAAAVAVARGLHTSTASQVLHDVGLVEYSVLLPLVAVVADTPARLTLFFRILVAAGIAATVVYFVVYNFESGSVLGGVENPGSGVGIYLSLAVLPGLAAILHGRPRALWLAPVVTVGAILMSMTVSRGTLLALIASLAVAVVVAPRGKRLVMTGLAAATVAASIGGASIATHAASALAPAPTPSLAVVVADPNYVTDDVGTGVLGGTNVRGDAAAGHWARRIDRGAYYIVPYLTNLQRKRAYTVTFWVKPLAPVMSGGAVGETAGTGWGLDRYQTAPVTQWQRFQKVLVPPTSSQRLIIAPDIGAPHVLIDGLQVRIGRRRGPAGDFRPPAPRLAPRWVADDAGTGLSGGTSVVGTAATGVVARRVGRGEQLRLERLRGARVGEAYTVSFSVRSADARRAVTGSVGLEGLSADDTVWRATGGRWTRVGMRVTADAPTAAVEIVPRTGPAYIDALQVVPGASVAALPPKNLHGHGTVADLPIHVAATEGTVKAAPSTVVGAIADSFDPRTVSGDNANARWRLAYWRFLIGRALQHPLFGVGFGHGAHFQWNGIVYDARSGDPRDGNDLTPPHNSFVNILYRTGFFGFLALSALIAVAAGRAWRTLRLVPASRRALVAGASAALGFIIVTCSLNVALEGPYMSVFFWSVLAVMLLTPRLRCTEPRADGA